MLLKHPGLVITGCVWYSDIRLGQLFCERTVRRLLQIAK